MTNLPASGSEGSGASTAFARLHERVREWVYRQRWSALRDIQEHAVDPVYQGKQDIIISAGTASGKTESAFLPICSELVGDNTPGVQALYIGPLKALINDQFERLERLCQDLDIKVHRWHGDVESNAKRRVIREPSGVLLITPESLEALFVLRGREIQRIFAPLRHIVVDELHAYIGTERGRQVQSLLHRLDAALGRRVQRIGLSATLGSPVLAAESLRPTHGGEALILQSREDKQEIQLQIRGYRDVEPFVVNREGQKSLHAVSPKTVVAPEGQYAICEHIFEKLRGTNNLVFSNTRWQVEAVTDRLVRLCELHRRPVEFFAHHGSLAKDHREFVEEQLKRGDRPATAICTSTLEMGIDIGRVKSIALLGPPPRVASLRQRLGRSGRRGEPAVLRIYVSECAIDGREGLQDRLRPELIQSIAMIRLLLEGWCEPPDDAAYHFSTLVQQSLSLLRERGGIGVQEAWSMLCKTGPFANVSASLFADLLRDLKEHDLISQMEDGTLTLGIGGEKLTDHYSFYTAFQTLEEWTLMTDGRTLGTLPIVQPLYPGLFIIFGGQRWRVVSVDPDRRDVFLQPAPGGVPPRFAGDGGLVHDRVRQEMLNVLRSTEMPAYVDDRARDLLAEGREHFARLRLVDQGLVAEGDSTVWFPWIGDRVMNTILVELKALGLGAMRDSISITVADIRPPEFVQILRRIASRGPADPLALAATVENKVIEKHDFLLREALLDLDYAAKRLDPIGSHTAACSATATRET